jgi:two-component system, cell cycle response regulator
MSVLIATKETVFRTTLHACLSRWGYGVQEAENSAAALRTLLNDEAPRLAVLDWTMPGMDGVEVCRRARAHSGPPYFYFLLLTPRMTSSDLMAGLEAGADDYIRKPFNPGELRARLRVGERVLALQAQLFEAKEVGREQATRDALTGLYNPRAFMPRLNTELSRARREGGALSVLLLDLDHFKRVNDGHGNQVGDDVISEMAARLASDLRPYDALGRYGGEKFIAVLPGCSVAAAHIVADRMRRVASMPIATDAGSLAVTISIGSASYAAGRSDAAELIALADAALYRAKSAGRNRVEAAT